MKKNDQATPATSQSVPLSASTELSWTQRLDELRQKRVFCAAGDERGEAGVVSLMGVSLAGRLEVVRFAWNHPANAAHRIHYVARVARNDV